jgi:hypothetical protein
MDLLMILFSLALLCTKLEANIDIKITNVHTCVQTYKQTMGQANSQYQDRNTMKLPKMFLVTFKRLGLLSEKMS